MTISKAFSWIQIPLKFVPTSPIVNKPALVQVMAWRQTGDKPLPELMLTQFIDAYMRSWGRWVNYSIVIMTTYKKSSFTDWDLAQP